MANCRSIPAAAAEAPTGIHQVLAKKNHELARVISQMTNRSASPILGPRKKICGRLVQCASRNRQREQTRQSSGTRERTQLRPFVVARRSEEFCGRESLRG